MDAREIAPPDHDDSCDSDEGDHYQTDDEKYIDEVIVEFGETVYSDIVVSAARGYPTEIIGSISGVILAWLMQVIFLLMIGIVATDEVKDKQKEFQWMSTSNDSYWIQGWAGDGSVTPPTEAYYACNGEDWSFQEAALGEMKKYNKQVFGSISYGSCFGLAALALWMAMCLKELFSIMNYSSLLAMKASPNKYHADFYQPPDQDGLLKGLSSMAKSCVAFVAIGRLTILVWLLWQGMKFLSYTETLKDFVLNSIALGFVLDIDELMFTVLVPHKRRRRVKTLSTVSVTQSIISRVTHYSDLVAVPLILLLCLVGYGVYLKGFASRYATAQRTLLCPIE